jgi:hypothetical protein
MKIKISETVIDSDWTNDSNHLTSEEARIVNERINWLINNYLMKVKDNGWEVLYQDPDDHRFWELTYPKGEMHGGGYPILSNITEKDATDKYFH